jgi:hypothetical protein
MGKLVKSQSSRFFKKMNEILEVTLPYSSSSNMVLALDERGLTSQFIGIDLHQEP